MFNTGIKVYLYSFFKNSIKLLRLGWLVPSTPFYWLTLEDVADRREGIEILPLQDGISRNEEPPTIIGHSISSRFTKYYNRSTAPLYVLRLKDGKVYGKDTNIIISATQKVIADVSREFGAEGGRRVSDFEIIKTCILFRRARNMSGTAAVISTCGSDNFHHWSYDILPRFEILRRVGVLDKIDYFLINLKGMAFQLEGLKLLGIDMSKVINTADKGNTLLKFDTLYVPSFSQQLSTISPFTVDFLRSVFFRPGDFEGKVVGYKRIFLSRKRVASRRIVNEAEVMELFFSNEFVEIHPEDYSVSEMAFIVAKASAIASVHGSGLSNLAFISEGTKVLDILAPYHQDPYYWMICNLRKSKYVGLFAEGMHPPDNADLVKRKVDLDLQIDLEKLKLALHELVGV
jgi:capsular polysaccharide biosynthesis protein